MMQRLQDIRAIAVFLLSSLENEEIKIWPALKRCCSRCAVRPGARLEDGVGMRAALPALGLTCRVRGPARLRRGPGRGREC
jgi:hypothetical protein